MRKEKSHSHAKLYKMINQEAKSWWWFKELRKRGETEKARAKERKSILSTLETIRKAQYAIIGYSGNAVVRYEGGSLTAYNQDFWKEVLKCRVPLVDMRGEGEKHALKAYALAVWGPMPEVGAEEKDEYGALDYAPLHIYLALAETLGMEVHWGQLLEKREYSLEKVRTSFKWLKGLLEKVGEL